MTRASFELWRRRLDNYLGMTHDKNYCQLIWAVQAIQTGKAERAKRYMTYPKGADRYGPEEEWSIWPWELETLLIQLMKTPKTRDRPGKPIHIYNKPTFGTVSDCVNILRSMVNSEAKILINRDNIFKELARTVHRQFPWNANFMARERLYMFSYVYAQGKCAAFFEQKYGIAFDQFFLTAFYFVTQLADFPWWNPLPLPDLISAEMIASTLAILAIEIEDARGEATRIAREGFLKSGVNRIEYQSSFLRKYPIMKSRALQDAIIAPLPGLIGYRMTSGLFYDFVGQQDLIDEANHRFEDFVISLIKGHCPDFQGVATSTYGPRKARIETPDVLIRHGTEVVAAIECKATKMTFEAQFADDPFSVADKAFNQLVKGVRQIWRFFANARNGTYVGETVTANAVGILLTIDDWFLMRPLQYQQIVDAARIQAADYPEITEEDMRPVVPCSIMDLHRVLARSTEEEVLQSLHAATEERYRQMALPEVRRQIAPMPDREKPFPFDFADLLPWWDRIPAE